MKNTDWGKLVARLLAVMLTLEVVQSVSTNWSVFSDPVELTYSWIPSLVYPLLTLAVAVCAWVFADRFAPGGDRAEVEKVGVGFAGAAVVASVAGYVFIGFVYSFLEGLIKKSTTVPPAIPPSMLGILFDLAVCLAAAVILANSRKVAEWAAR